MSEGEIRQLKLEDLQHAVNDKAASLRCRIRLQSDAGDGGKVFPATYAGGVYAVEDRRIDGRVVRCVLLDSVQSQANRMEEALQDAFLPNWRQLRRDGDDPKCDFPIVAVYVENHGWVTSLTAPHRIHDAILRDSNLNGTRFRESQIGQAIVKARLHDATAFYSHCPTALLFGTWDSTAGEGLDSAKIPRAIVSEIIGVEVTPGVRTGSRIDPLGIRAQSATIYRRKDGDWALKNQEDIWMGATDDEIEKDKNGNPKRFGKRGKPSDINHGNVTPDMPRFDRQGIRDSQLDRLPDILGSNPIKLRYEVESADGRLESRTELDGQPVRIREGAVKPGGITMAYALHTWTLSLTQLRRLRFPVNGKHEEARDRAARTVLAALALYAFALERDRGYWLRSRCELIPEHNADGRSIVLEQIGIDGTMTFFVVPEAEAAKALLKEACEEAGKDLLVRAGKSERCQESEANLLPNPGWEQRVIRLTPTAKLVELVRASDQRQPDDEGDVQGPEEGPEEEETADVDAES